MIIPYIAKSAVDAAEISELFDSAAIPFHPIAVVNWPKEFPYTPGVKFRIAHNGSMILIEYVVAEEYVRAMAESDNGHVWEDSCVEMFITFDGSHYYNIECNCRGKVLLACGPKRNDRTYSTPEQVALIRRSPSIADAKPFDSRPAQGEWSMRLAIPAEAFFADRITDLRGIHAKANFYKCGDRLPTAHFLSWQPIPVASPDFHLPQYFGDVIFE